MVEEKMACECIDLPCRVAAGLLQESYGNIQMSNANARNASQEINALMGRSSARKFDEMGTIESRANSGVLATPIAGPTNAQGTP